MQQYWVKKGEQVEIENITFLSDPIFFSLYIIINLPFSPGYPLESEGSFVNLFGNFSSLCGVA